MQYREIKQEKREIKQEKNMRERLKKSTLQKTKN